MAWLLVRVRGAVKLKSAILFVNLHDKGNLESGELAFKGHPAISGIVNIIPWPAGRERHCRR